MYHHHQSEECLPSECLVSGYKKTQGFNTHKLNAFTADPVTTRTRIEYEYNKPISCF